MKEHQDQPNKKNFIKDSEEDNRALDPRIANINNERDERKKEEADHKKVKNDRHSTKFSHTKRIRPLL